jgi:hypothetical protein
MITNYVELFLSKESYYTYRQSLDGNEYIFTFRYNSRERRWYMDLANADRTPLILGVKLVPNYPLLDGLNIETLDGFFWLSADIEENVPLFYERPEEMPDLFTLRYFYEA